MENLIKSIIEACEIAKINTTDEEVKSVINKIGVEKAKKKSLIRYIKHYEALREITINNMFKELKIDTNSDYKVFRLWGKMCGNNQTFSEEELEKYPTIYNIIIYDNRIIINGYNKKFELIEEINKGLEAVTKIENYRVGVIQSRRDTILTIKFGEEVVVVGIGQEYASEETTKLIDTFNEINPKIVDRELLNKFNLRAALLGF